MCTQILLWTILPLAVILIGVAYLGVNSHPSAMRDLVEERDGALARVAAARVSEAIANRATILQALDPARPETWEAERTAFEGGIVSFDARGNLLNAIPSRQVWEARRAATANMLVPQSTFSALSNESGATRVIVVISKSNTVLAGAFALPPLGNAVATWVRLKSAGVCQ